MLIFCACGGPSGRIKEKGEASLVGDRRAGTVVYRRLIDGSLKELSLKFRLAARNSNAPKIRVAFFGIDNRTNEELGSWRDQLNDIINGAINESADFQDVSFENFVKPALETAGVKPDRLVIPAEARKLLAVLEKNNQVLDAFLFARLTQGDTTQGNLKQSDYILTFELVNPLDGIRLMSREEISKEYTR
ncbi:MAG: hypothetical protein HY717_21335 [Planctomycetes bacterium]|nr:hypothetical protein [Planctomycetota bacterium]